MLTIMADHLGGTNPYEAGEGEKLMMSEEDQRFIDNLVKTESEFEQPGNEEAALIREVLVDVVRDYMLRNRTTVEIRDILKKKQKYLMEDLKDILRRYDFTKENISERAAHIAKILEDDIDIEIDAVIAKEEQDMRNEPEHAHDDRGRAFWFILRKHPRIGEVLEIMVDKPEKLSSLAPYGKEKEYVKEFERLLNEFLLTKDLGKEWELTPDGEKFLIEYVLKFAHEFLRSDTKKKKPA